MRIWVFNQQQLEAALKARRERIGDPRDRGQHDSVEAAVDMFLNSPEAREHKLILEVLDDRPAPAEKKP